jgi:SNF2 family DNA or RNA helicase
VIVDEAHNLKNPETARARAVARVHAAFRLLLTATPISLGTHEFYNLCRLASPGFFGTAASFKLLYTDCIEEGGIDAELALDDLRVALNSVYLARACEDLSLPDCHRYIVVVAPSSRERELYAAISGAGDARDSERPGAALAKTVELRGVCNDPLHATSPLGVVTTQGLWQVTPTEMRGRLGLSSKMLAITTLVEEILRESDDGVVVVFNRVNHREGPLRTLAAHLREMLGGLSTVAVLTGATKNRTALVERFNDRQSGGGGPRVLLLSITLAAGLTLTGGSHCLLVAPEWNPTSEEQALGRVWRVPQNKPCHLYNFILAGTIEEAIFIRGRERIQLALAVTSDGAPNFEDLSDDLARSLFALGAIWRRLFLFFWVVRARSRIIFETAIFQPLGARLLDDSRASRSPRR